MERVSITPSAAALKAMAHPVRLRIIGILRGEGPATATTLAQRLGLNSGATSYHLRQLALHGFIEDDADRGNGRDRWWRAKHESTRTTPDTDDSVEGREAVDAFAQAIGVVHTEQLQRALEEAPTRPLPWRRASTLSDWGIRLTPERAEELLTRIEELIDEVVEEQEGTPDAAPFILQLHAFPRPGVVPPEGVESAEADR